MMTVDRLISEHEHHNTGSVFFSSSSLKFFGERRSEMRVLKDTVVMKDFLGESHECYVLSTYQRNNPLGPRRHYYYFDINTYELIDN